ncbi:unnamed protein product [Chrysoparadoxa australica]
MLREYLLPTDEAFNHTRKSHYAGFEHQPANTISNTTHRSFASLFRELDAAGLFLYDIVQAGGKTVSKTYVTRTLVGEPGITYKYLGTRIFAHPWEGRCLQGPRGKELAGSDDGGLWRGGVARAQERLRKAGVPSTLAAAGKLNKWMVARAATAATAAPESCAATRGSCNFNLALINCMDSGLKGLKPEPLHNMGTCSVSWHADSCLEDYSTIGVYHCTKPEAGKEWRIAMRCSDKDGPEGEAASGAPPMVMPLASGDLYMLLGNFNHNREHAVLTGKTSLRYSSTHRVSVVEGNTYQEMAKSASEVLDSNPTTPAALQQQQAIMTELETEWICQFYEKGQIHAEVHTWWHGPIMHLCQLWSQLNDWTEKCIERHCSAGPSTPGISSKTFKVLMRCLEERQQQRVKRQERVASSAFARMPEGLRPVDPPLCMSGPQAIKRLAADIKRLRSSYGSHCNGNNLTARSVAAGAQSNWDALKRKQSSSSSVEATMPAGPLLRGKNQSHDHVGAVAGKRKKGAAGPKTSGAQDKTGQGEGPRRKKQRSAPSPGSSDLAGLQPKKWKKNNRKVAK